jgi:hypothetical protein
MLLTFDGDHPQIEAVFNKVLARADPNHIELLKFPGGSSLQFQPNDLMRSHAIIHQYVKSTHYANAVFRDPVWMPQFEVLLAHHKIDKASVDCFVGFFQQIPVVISKAFSHTTITSGWATSGIYPFSAETIMEKCSKWDLLDEEQRVRCREAIPILMENTRLSGICRDSDIAALVGDIVMTEIKGMDGKVINQQRSLWMNKDGVLQHRRHLHAEKQRILQIAREKQLAAEKRAEEKKRLLEEQAVRHEPRVDATVVTSCFNEGCKDATFLRQIKPTEDDKWRGCRYCGVFYCHKKACYERLLKHMPVCKRRKEVMQTHTNSVQSV